MCGRGHAVHVQYLQSDDPRRVIRKHCLRPRARVGNRGGWCSQSLVLVSLLSQTEGFKNLSERLSLALGNWCRHGSQSGGRGDTGRVVRAAGPAGREPVPCGPVLTPSGSWRAGEPAEALSTAPRIWEACPGTPAQGRHGGTVSSDVGSQVSWSHHGSLLVPTHQTGPVGYTGTCMVARSSVALPPTPARLPSAVILLAVAGVRGNGTPLRLERGT